MYAKKKILRVYLSRNRLESGSAKPEAVNNAPPTGFLYRKGGSKAKKLLMGCSLQPSWLFVIDPASAPPTAAILEGRKARAARQPQSSPERRLRLADGHLARARAPSASNGTASWPRSATSSDWGFAPCRAWARSFTNTVSFNPRCIPGSRFCHILQMRNRLRDVKWLAQPYTGSWGERQGATPRLLILNSVLFPTDYAISFKIFLYDNSLCKT